VAAPGEWLADVDEEDSGGVAGIIIRSFVTLRLCMTGRLH